MLSLVTGETDVICSLLLYDSLPVASMRDVCVSTRVFEHVHSRHPYVTGRGGWGWLPHTYTRKVVPNVPLPVCLGPSMQLR